MNTVFNYAEVNNRLAELERKELMIQGKEKLTPADYDALTNIHVERIKLQNRIAIAYGEEY